MNKQKSPIPALLVEKTNGVVVAEETPGVIVLTLNHEYTEQAKYLATAVNAFPDLHYTLYRMAAMYGSLLEQNGTNRENNADWREANRILEQLKTGTYGIAHMG